MDLLSRRGALVIFTALRALEITTVQEQRPLKPLRSLKLFPRRCLKLTRTRFSPAVSIKASTALYQCMNDELVCSVSSHKQRCLLFCLFVADRPWFLFAVRPDIAQSYSLTY